MTDFVSGKGSVMGTKPKLLLLERGLSKTLRIMKLTAVFLLAAALQVTAKGIAQEKITLALHNASLEKVFEQIEVQTGFVFIYKDETVKDKKVSILVTNATLAQALDVCLKGQDLSYQIVGKSVAIKPEKAAMMLSGGEVPPFIDVRGRVLNEKGEPVEGVTVLVKGIDKKTLTDKNGEFSLTTVEQDAVLVFTHIGMETFELKVSGKTELAISLRTKVSALGDVVVTVNTGYQQIPKERSTGSFGIVNNEQLNRKAGTDILSRLEGTTTGIQFDRRMLQPTQNTLATSNVMIRGISTLTDDMKSPLIVLDNFPYDGDISNINPNDIQSITVLKDAAAASIWGARAGNGVIVITTKRGQYNQPFKLVLNNNMQILSKPDLFAYPKMSSNDYIDLEKYLFDQGFYDGMITDPSFPPLSPVVELLEKKRAGVITAQEADEQINLFRDLDIRNDFDKYVYRSGSNLQHALSLSGGGQKLKYSLMGGYDNSRSTLDGNSSRRVTFRSINTFSPVKDFEINLGLAYTNSLIANNSLGDLGGNNYNTKNSILYPYAQFADENGYAVPIAKDYRFDFSDTAGGGKLLDWKYRPLDEMRNSDNKTKLNNLLFNLGASYKLNSFISFSVNYQYQKENAEIRNHYNKQSYYARNMVNLFTQLQGNTIINIVPKGGILDMDHSEMISHIGRGQINVNKRWNSLHEITGILGGEIRERKTTLETQRFYGFDENKYTNAPVDYVNFYPQYGSSWTNKIEGRNNIYMTTDHFVSLYGNVAYSYNNKYTLSASARRDAANLFGVNANNKWKPFWTTGAAWNIHNEKFYKSNLFPYLRLRLTYGYQGNVNNSISPYTIIKASSFNNVANLPWAQITNAANPDLSWERLGQINVGLDFKIGQRIMGALEVYRKKSDNLLWAHPNDATTGVVQVKSNSATMVGKGVELSLSSQNIKGVFEWQTEFGVTYSTNTVTDYSSFLDQNTLAYGLALSNGLQIVGRRGKSPYPVFSFPFAGLDPNTGDPLGYLGKNVSNDYRAIFDQLYDTTNLTYHGSSIPTYYGFINNIFRYKNISLVINLNYKLGYYFKKNTINYYGLVNLGNQHPDYEKRWQAPGDEMITNVPSFSYPLTNSERDDFYANSSVNVHKGDHIRLQNIRLAYSIARSQVKGLPCQSIQVYANAENLGIIWRADKDEKLDPDYNTGNAPFPLPKVFTVGLQFDF